MLIVSNPTPAGCMHTPVSVHEQLGHLAHSHRLLCEGLLMALHDDPHGEPATITTTLLAMPIMWRQRSCPACTAGMPGWSRTLTARSLASVASFQLVRVVAASRPASWALLHGVMLRNSKAALEIQQTRHTHTHTQDMVAELSGVERAFRDVPKVRGTTAPMAERPRLSATGPIAKKADKASGTAAAADAECTDSASAGGGALAALVTQLQRCKLVKAHGNDGSIVGEHTPGTAAFGRRWQRLELDALRLRSYLACLQVPMGALQLLGAQALGRPPGGAGGGGAVAAQKRLKHRRRDLHVAAAEAVAVAKAQLKSAAESSGVDATAAAVVVAVAVAVVVAVAVAVAVVAAGGAGQQPAAAAAEASGRPNKKQHVDAHGNGNKEGEGAPAKTLLKEYVRLQDKVKYMARSEEKAKEALAAAKTGNMTAEETAAAGAAVAAAAPADATPEVAATAAMIIALKDAINKRREELGLGSQEVWLMNAELRRSIRVPRGGGGGAAAGRVVALCSGLVGGRRGGMAAAARLLAAPPRRAAHRPGGGTAFQEALYRCEPMVREKYSALNHLITQQADLGMVGDLPKAAEAAAAEADGGSDGAAGGGGGGAEDGPGPSGSGGAVADGAEPGADGGPSGSGAMPNGLGKGAAGAGTAKAAAATKAPMSVRNEHR
ncbi:hypothetical protein HYH02_006535 [Chlamydomonas schloesseri]|uniref:Uncharacterized protein n=1 Tax=Chlamydomonas schloesseri TaxID=2026947 RepID=A0A835T7S1_9CHLO|nr:hypothetical protein HYH02_006535 [Chlamydomonas schloesseri]|eukprot:KAG2439006.1 hypothetical protein HYH02_006535 [Chlamydomonas schloesseri]